jgi:hypothetical protein
MRETIYILTINHRHGSNISAHKSQEGALNALAQYVAQEWEQEMPEGRSIPENEGDAIESYFSRMEDQESFGIEETELAD